MPRLAIFATAGAAYRFVWRARRDFLALAFPAILALAIVTVAIQSFARGGRGLDLVISIVAAIVWVVFSVAWHRRFLLPGEVHTVAAALSWRRRHTRFLLVTLALYATIMVVVAAGSIAPILLASGASNNVQSAVSFAVIVIAVIGGMLLFVRLSLLFPAAAINHALTVRDCWERTAGNGWRLLAISVIVGLPLAPVQVAFGLLMRAIGGGALTASFIHALLQQTVALLGIALAVTTLSIAFRALVEPGPGSATT